MFLPYKTRRFLRGLGIAALILVLVLVIAWLIWLLWLDRYVVYTRDGAILDFDRSDRELSGEVAQPPEDDFTVSLYYNEGEQTLNYTTELVQVYGYYIDADMLENEMDTVMAQLRKLPSQTPVLVEVKDIVGRFCYSTTLGPVRKGIDTAKVADLFNYLKLSDLYAIAEFSSLRDYYYGLEHVDDGIFLRSGKGLWMDSSKCYWLNPARTNIQTYLVQIVNELKVLGFNEVVLGDFAIPDTDQIKFSGSKQEALAAAAKAVMDNCSSELFAISFCVSDPTFALPEGRTRMYLKDASASSLRTVAEETGIDDPTVRLVFITEANDTRYDEFGVLRPLNTAQLEEE